MSTLPPNDDNAEPLRITEWDAESPAPGHPAEPPPDAVLKPEPPGPGPWMAIFYCVVYLLVTQVVLAITVAIPVFLILLFNHPESEAILESIREGTLQDTEFFDTLLGQTLAWTIVFAKILEVGFALWLLRYVVGRDWMRKVAFRWPHTQHLLLAAIGLPALWVAGVGFSSLLQMAMPEQSGELAEALEQMFSELNKFPAWLALLTIAVCPGFAEEFLCRALLGRGLKARMGLWGGIAFTSILFGAIHILPAQAVYAAFLGIFLHAAYYFTRSLWVPILLHFGNNAISTLLVRGNFGALAVEDPAAKAAVDLDPSLHWSLYVAAGFLLAAVSLAIYRSRCVFESVEPGVEPWRPAYVGVTLPPPGSGTVVRSPFAGALAWGAVVLAAGAFAACLRA